MFSINMQKKITNLSIDFFLNVVTLHMCEAFEILFFFFVLTL